MKQFLIAFDQLCNTLIGGMADETLSARAWRLHRVQPDTWGRMRVAIDHLFFWQKDHCFNAYMSEMDRKQLPAEYGHAVADQV